MEVVQIYQLGSSFLNTVTKFKVKKYWCNIQYKKILFLCQQNFNKKQYNLLINLPISLVIGKN